MARINLRDQYPSEYKADHFIEVSEEVAGYLAGNDREEHAYYERRRYHRAFYSLNTGDGIENDAVNTAPSSEEVFFDNLTRDQLDAALSALPEKQHKRIVQHYYLGMSKAEIARAEGLAENAVKDAIYRGLKNMEQKLKNVL